MVQRLLQRRLKERYNELYFLYLFKIKLILSWLLVPIPVEITATCQNVKGCCNLFIEPQLTSFLVFYNFPRVFRIFTVYRSTRWCRLSGKFWTHRDARLKQDFD